MGKVNCPHCGSESFVVVEVAPGVKGALCFDCGEIFDPGQDAKPLLVILTKD